MVGAKTLRGLETSGAYIYMFEESFLRILLLSVFPEKLILHFYIVFVSTIDLLLSGVVFFIPKIVSYIFCFGGSFSFVLLGIIELSTALCGNYRTFLTLRYCKRSSSPLDTNDLGINYLFIMRSAAEVVAYCRRGR